MSKSYWIAAIASASAIILIAALASGVYYYSNNASRAQDAASQYRAYAERTVSCEEVIPLSERYACLLDAIEAEQQRIYSAADLQAQQDMAVWTFGMLWVSIAMLFVTGLGVTYVALTLEEARAATVAATSAANITREIGQKQVRAYLSVEKVTANFTDGAVEFRVYITNSGNSPAIDVAIKGRAFVTMMPNESGRVAPQQSMEVNREIHDISAKSKGLGWWSFNIDTEKAGYTVGWLFVQINGIVYCKTVFPDEPGESVSFDAMSRCELSGSNTGLRKTPAAAKKVAAIQSARKQRRDIDEP